MAEHAGASVRPTGAPLGAEVSGADLRDLDDAGFKAIHKAWLDHSVLLFRGQHLSDDELAAFSRRFGNLDLAPVQENGRTTVEGRPEIYVVSNVLGADGAPIGSLGAGEAVWHTDMSYLSKPPKASMLYALEIPPEGGDTWFSDMRAAYDNLPEGLKRQAATLRVKHDGTYNSGGYVRAGVTPSDDPRTSPGTLHPLVCSHPETGRRMLYLGPPPQRLHRGTAAAGVGGAAGRDLEPRDVGRIHLAAPLACGRPGTMGQPLHHAPA